MIIAVPVTDNMPSGPGEAMEIVIIDTDSSQERERYENPALTAVSGRGIAMLRSAMERNVEALVVGGIGQHAFEVARRNMKIFDGKGLTLDELSEKIKNGELKELTSFNHSHHSGEHH